MGSLLDHSGSIGLEPLLRREADTQIDRPCVCPFTRVLRGLLMGGTKNLDTPAVEVVVGTSLTFSFHLDSVAST